MAACNMASPASGFVLKTNLATNISSSTSRIDGVSLSAKYTNGGARRLVIQAAEEAAALLPPPPPATAPPKPAEGSALPIKPPPIGPKRGTK
ncbi:hypothetical protein Ancab_024450, partial [Ancistrocladus abbreviatus]